MNERIRVWDLPVRVFHWGLAAAFFGAYVLSESHELLQIHILLGYTALGLIVFRLIWGFVGTRYARFGSFLYGPSRTLRYLRSAFRRDGEEYIGHNPAGSWAIWAILALGLATGISGTLTYFGPGGHTVEEIHELFGNAWLAVVVLHIAGVIASSIAHRENLVRAMITGYKAGAASAGVQSLARAAGVGVAVAVAVFWVLGLASGSFTAPPAHEAQEHGQHAARDGERSRGPG